VANESNDPGKTQAAPEGSAARAVPAPSIDVWTRIKEHKVAQWTLAYAAAAYAALDGMKIMSETFDWPHQLVRVVTVLLILGLPLVVTLAWYHGHRALHRVSGSELTIITVLLVIAGGVLWHFARSPQESLASKVATSVQTTVGSVHPVAATPAKGSIAVLPFVDMSEKHDQEYFSDGLSEELIDHLAHFPDLKVIARTSSFAFKGKNEDMRSIATKLGVANLLEGSVRKAGGELRITAQLIRALDGVHLWSEIYDRKLTDIFKVQDEISTTVAKALNAALNVTPAAGVQPDSKGTINVDAYSLLLKANYFFKRGRKGDDAEAIEHYQQALKLEPNYALAWANLARVYADQGGTGELTAAEAAAKGLEAVQRALAIDPNCAEAYYARGNILRGISGSWAAAKSAYERALELDPHGEVGQYSQGVIILLKAVTSGRLNDVFDWARRQLERNPLDMPVISSLAWLQLIAGHLDESAATSQKLLELDPAYAGAQAQYAGTLLFMGKNSEALAAAEKESDSASKLAALACIYWASGRRTESDSALRALERGFADRNQYTIAAVHAYRGEMDAAFTWLERAYQQNRGSLEVVKIDPLFQKLHGDPRFDALLRKMKLVE